MKILISDDDRDMLNLLRFILSDEGYEIETAENGEEAIQKISQNKYQLMLLDYDLRDMTGFDVIKYMKDHNISSKIIMISGHSKNELKPKTVELGVDKLMSKPFEVQALLENVNSIAQKVN